MLKNASLISVPLRNVSECQKICDDFFNNVTELYTRFEARSEIGEVNIAHPAQPAERRSKLERKRSSMSVKTISNAADEVVELK